MTEVINWAVPGFCGLGLYFTLDGFRLVYLCTALLMWGISGIFSVEYMAHYQNRKRYYWFFWATFVATAGVFLSADLFTTFIFFEIMSFTSYVWVAFDEKKESLRAAQTYLAVAVIGGMVMLMGLFLLYGLLGTLRMDEIGAAARQVLAGHGKDKGYPFPPSVQLYLAGGLMLFGFGAKAGCFPLHIWLPKAHPVAPAPASALLSGILTKTGVFGVLVISCNLFLTDRQWGKLVMGLGIVTMFLGALLALFSINLKRTLACSSVSQMGFILTGIGTACLLGAAGEGNALAVRGTFLHMVNHSLIKLVLFLCAGVVFMNLHQLNLNEIRGYGRKKPALLFCFLMGALGIGGIPLWNGYVSKTLLHEAIVEYGGPAWIEWVFLLTGGMTVAYMVKLFVALFVDWHPVRQAEFDRQEKSYMTPLSRLVLVSAAVILPVLGIIPGQAMDKIADMGQPFFHGDLLEHQIHYFSMRNLKGALISIGIGAILYSVVVRRFLMDGEGHYLDRWPAWLDLENLIYRPVIEVALPGICGAVCQCMDRYLVPVAVRIFVAAASVLCRGMDHLADGGILLARRTTHSQRRRHGITLPDKLVKLEMYAARIGKEVEQSFSFGLMLFCIGLCLTLGYLLLVFFE